MEPPYNIVSIIEHASILLSAGSSAIGALPGQIDHAVEILLLPLAMPTCMPTRQLA